jgi:regulation of enolase protein 1 (concanavalin A-like superfamily)
MVRIAPDCWIKTSVEYETDTPWQLGAVVTNHGYSDWSTQAFPAGRNDAWFRIKREGTDYTVLWSEDGAAWQQLRVTHLHADAAGAPVACGIYACSPKGAGYMAEFTTLTLE